MRIRFSLRCCCVVALLVALGCAPERELPAAPLAGVEALASDAVPLPFEARGETALIDFPEASGLAWHPLRKTLFVVSDDGHLGEFRTDGTELQRRHLLYEDFEAIACHSGTGLLYLAIEGRDNLLEVDPDGLVIRREYDLDRVFEGRKLYELGGEGIEGLAFVPDATHPEGGTFFVANRSRHPKDLDDPPLIFEVELPVTSTSNGELEGRILGYSRLQATELSGLHYDVAAGSLYALSDDNQLLLELTRTGEIVNVYEVPVEDPEGIAFDDQGFLYIARDSGGVVALQPSGTAGE